METPPRARLLARRGLRPRVLIGANGRLRGASTARLARRELGAAVRGPSLYVMVTVGCLVAAVIVNSYLDFVADMGTVVLADPLRAPLLFALLATTAYLGLLAAASLAGERERGTLEVLFYGPVDAFSAIGGKLVGHTAAYLLAAVVIVGFLAATAWLTGMPLRGGDLLLAAASVVPAASMIALGLVFGALLGRLRSALALTALTIASLVGIDVGSEIAAAQPGDTLLGSAAGVLSMLATAVGWVSPIGHLFLIEDALTVGSAADVLLALGTAVAYAAVLTALAVAILRRRGVLRWRE